MTKKWSDWSGFKLENLQLRALTTSCMHYYQADFMSTGLISSQIIHLLKFYQGIDLKDSLNIIFNQLELLKMNISYVFFNTLKQQINKSRGCLIKWQKAPDSMGRAYYKLSFYKNEYFQHLYC